MEVRGSETFPVRGGSLQIANLDSAFGDKLDDFNVPLLSYSVRSIHGLLVIVRVEILVENNDNACCCQVDTHTAYSQRVVSARMVG